MAVRIAMVVAAAYVMFVAWERFGALPDSKVYLTVGAILAVVIAGLIWVAGCLASKYRAKKPGPNQLRSGRIAYWVGCSLAVYCLVVGCYGLYLIFRHEAVYDLVHWTSQFLFAAAAYWGIGRGIRYVLGQ